MELFVVCLTGIILCIVYVFARLASQLAGVEQYDKALVSIFAAASFYSLLVVVLYLG